MGRPHDYSTLPAHPAVGTHYKRQVSQYGRGTTVCADVTCAKCGTVRSFPLYTLRQQMKRPNFSGDCRACTIKAARSGHIRWHKERFKDGAKWIANNGYVMLGISAIADEDLPLFRGMLNKAGAIGEHRFVMAKALGRPLRTNEAVDHMDGVKTNNDLANLRIYVVGKNQPGSLNGHGTYYHEWQMAEARNRLLMDEVEKLRTYVSSKMT